MRKKKISKTAAIEKRHGKKLNAMLVRNADDCDKELLALFKDGHDLMKTRVGGKWDPLLDLEDTIAGLIVDVALKLGERRGMLNAAHDVEIGE